MRLPLLCNDSSSIFPILNVFSSSFACFLWYNHDGHPRMTFGRTGTTLDVPKMSSATVERVRTCNYLGRLVLGCIANKVLAGARFLNLPCSLFLILWPWSFQRLTSCQFLPSPLSLLFVSYSKRAKGLAGTMESKNAREAWRKAIRRQDEACRKTQTDTPGQRCRRWYWRLYCALWQQSQRTCPWDNY